MFKTRGKIAKQDLPTPDSITEVQVKRATEAEKKDLLRSDRDAYHPEQVKQKKTRQFHFALVFAAMLLIAVGVGVAWFYDRIEGGSIAVDDLTSMVITLDINSQPQVIATNCTTVEELLNQERIRLTEDDYLGLELDQSIYDGMTIWLRLAVTTTINADGQTYSVHSQPVTVSRALELAGVSFDEDDETDLPLLSYIYTDSTINVSRLETRREVVDEDIECPVVTREFTYLAPGSSTIVTPGDPGLRQSTYDVTYRDGVEISRELVSSVVLREPTETIQGVGPDVSAVMQVDEAGNTVAQLATAADGSEFYYSKAMTVEATAYTWTGNRTATGTWPEQGRTIAVDPDVIPLNTQVYVVGYGFAKAEDTGGAINGHIIDLYMDEQQDCVNWGRRDVTLYVLAE